MNKKLIIGVVIIAIGVGGYILYKSSKPSRKMFDEMVDSCQPPCDVFEGLTESQKDKLYKGFQTLKKEDAQFMVDYIKNVQKDKNNANASSDKKFVTLQRKIVLFLTK